MHRVKRARKVTGQFYFCSLTTHVISSGIIPFLSICVIETCNKHNKKQHRILLRFT